MDSVPAFVLRRSQQYLFTKEHFRMAYIPYPAWIRPEIVSFLPIRWYGLMYLAAFLVTFLLFRYQLKERGLKPQKGLVLDMFFWAIVGLLLGARLFAVTIYDPTGYYLRHPLQIILPLSIVDGKIRLTGISGMSYHGGLVGVAVALVIFMKVKKIDALDWSDMLVAGIPLGYTFGRLGNFINAELYGRVTRVPWGMVFPGSESFPASEQWVTDYASAVGIPIPSSGLVNLPRHPSQLYEGFFEGLVLWLIIWFILRKRKPFKGFLLAFYVLGYGLFRFIIEYAREPDKGIGYPITLVPLGNPSHQFSLLNFTTGQILCFFMIVAAVICLFVFRDRARRQALQDPTLPNGRKLKRKIT
jgi:phosphatidylglycerol:prolipoprotein diacylglycerol transferase